MKGQWEKIDRGEKSRWTVKDGRERRKWAEVRETTSHTHACTHTDTHIPQRWRQGWSSLEWQLIVLCSPLTQSQFWTFTLTVGTFGLWDSLAAPHQDRELEHWHRPAAAARAAAQAVLRSTLRLPAGDSATQSFRKERVTCCIVGNVARILSEACLLHFLFHIFKHLKDSEKKDTTCFHFWQFCATLNLKMYYLKWWNMTHSFFSTHHISH